jgi:peptide deformylase
MSILKIAQMGHPVLRQIARPVDDPAAPGIQHLIRDMIETMADANGAGLAAPQVYQSLRIVVFQAPSARIEVDIEGEEAFDHQADLTVLINPVIEILSREITYGWEGCLSVTGLRGLVPRADHIRYSGIGMDGAPIVRIARGFHARVVQHECDHLDGILYPQRMDDLSMLVFAQEMRHGLPKPVATPPLIFPEET